MLEFNISNVGYHINMPDIEFSASGLSFFFFFLILLKRRILNFYEEQFLYLNTSEKWP